MRVIRPATVVAIALLVGAPGCGREPTRAPVTSVQISLRAAPAAGSPASPVALGVTVTNTGDTQVWHCQGCGCGNAVTITVLGPDGSEVAMLDPNRPRPLCIDVPVVLERGATLSHDMVFNGTLYVQGSAVLPTPTYSAPAGRYKVIGGFEYGTTSGFQADSILVGRTTTFDWQP